MRMRGKGSVTRTNDETRGLWLFGAVVVCLSLSVAASARALQEIELPEISGHLAGGELVLVRVMANVSCLVSADRSLVTCSTEAKYELENVGKEEATHGAITVDGDAVIECRRGEAEEPCSHFALAPGDALSVTLRAERSFEPTFERRWIRDPSVVVIDPHGGSSDPIPSRHPLTSRNGGFGRLTLVTVVFRAPRGVKVTDESIVLLGLQGHALFDDRRHVHEFGRHRGFVREGEIRAGILGGPTLALGHVRRSGIATRAGYEVGFGRYVPFGFEVAHEWSPDRGHGFSSTVFVSSSGMFGGAFGIGPSFRFEDGMTAGARLAFDIMFFTPSAHFLTLLTFERNQTVSVGWYLGVTL
jgi:hypothetical protein